jgi:hypothetical protein
MALQNSKQTIQSSAAPFQSSIFPIQRITPLRRGDMAAARSYVRDI